MKKDRGWREKMGMGGKADKFPTSNLNCQKNASLVPAKYETSDLRRVRVSVSVLNKCSAMIATASASVF